MIYPLHPFHFKWCESEFSHWICKVFVSCFCLLLYQKRDSFRAHQSAALTRNEFSILFYFENLLLPIYEIFAKMFSIHFSGSSFRSCRSTVSVSIFRGKFFVNVKISGRIIRHQRKNKIAIHFKGNTMNAIRTNTRDFNECQRSRFANNIFFLSKIDEMNGNDIFIFHFSFILSLSLRENDK